MLLFERRAVLFGLAALPIAACGFQPVYRQGSAATALAGNIIVDLIDSREGFELLERLETHLGSARPSAEYGLAIDLEITEESLSIGTTGVVSRQNVLGAANISVRSMATGDVLFAERVEITTAYSVTSATAATAAAKRGAYQQVALALADKINLRLAVTAADWVQ